MYLNTSRFATLKSMSKRLAGWHLILILLGGLILRDYHTTTRSIWFDEAFTWRLVRVSIPEMVMRTAADVHPPLYYLALKGWTTLFGTHLISLRSFSSAAAALTIIMGYLFVAYALRSRRAGVIAALLIAASA